MYICGTIFCRLRAYYFSKLRSLAEANFRNIEECRFVNLRSLWNLTGTSPAMLPMCLSDFKAMRSFKLPISRLRDFTRSYDKTSYRILKQGPGHYCGCRRPSTHLPDGANLTIRFEISSSKLSRFRFFICHIWRHIQNEIPRSPESICWQSSGCLVDAGGLVPFWCQCICNTISTFSVNHHICFLVWTNLCATLQWRHNGLDSLSNHQPHDCLLNHLFRRRSKKTSKLRVTGLWGPVNSAHKWPVTRKMFPFDDVIMRSRYQGRGQEDNVGYNYLGPSFDTCFWRISLHVREDFPTKCIWYYCCE